MPDRNKLIADCASLLAEDVDQEGLVAFLRTQGCYKIDSIAVLCAVLGLDLARAKQLVHCSETWADAREADDQLHEAAVEAVETLRREMN